MEGLIKESKINMNSRNEFMDKTGINDTQMAKIEQLFEENITVEGHLHEHFKIEITNGTGKYEKDKYCAGKTISGDVTITAPEEGTWHVIAKDGNDIIFEEYGIKKGVPVHFKYTTSIWRDTNLSVTFIWSISGNTTLEGDLDADY